jgi:hypothetical protein
MMVPSTLVPLQKVLRRIPFAPLDVNCLHCLEYLADGGNSGESANPSIVIRAGTPLDIPRMSECRNFPERLPERFAAQEHCVVAMIGDDVVAYQWFCDKTSRIEERYGYRVEIPPDSIYGYDAFVRPQYRRAKIWTHFHSFYLKDILARLGRRKVIVMVDQGNSVSMRAHSRVGYRLYRKIYVAKLLGKSVWISKAVERGDEGFRSVAPQDATETRADQISSALS